MNLLTASLLDPTLFVIGIAMFAVLFVPFSPMTIDLLTLPRHYQIGIYRRRHVFWAIGIACFALLLARAAAAQLPALGWVGSVVGFAHPGWFVVTVITIAVLAVAFWSGYVPYVMTPPRNPKVLTAAEGDEFLKPDDVVLGFEYRGQARAYPRDAISRPHFYVDDVADTRFVVSYCILCNSAMAFRSELGGRPLDLMSVTAFNNNIVYYDPVSGNFIQQLEGRVIDGPDAGTELELFPVTITSWGEWRRLFPETTLYYAPDQTLRDRIVSKMLQVMIPIHRLARRSKPWHRIRGSLDPRLPAMSFVYGVRVHGEACAYPESALRRSGVINDTVGGEPIVVFFDDSKSVGQVFSRCLSGRALHFVPEAGSEGSWAARDRETSSRWSVTGEAIAGPLQGNQLTPVPHVNRLFWFSWALFNPYSHIVEGDQDSPGQQGGERCQSSRRQAAVKEGHR